MATAALKFIPVTSAWCSPTLEKLGAAIEAEKNRTRNEDRASELRHAFDLACELDEVLGKAGWAA